MSCAFPPSVRSLVLEGPGFWRTVYPAWERAALLLDIIVIDLLLSRCGFVVIVVIGYCSSFFCGLWFVLGGLGGLALDYR
jgi:hypothetical protein